MEKIKLGEMDTYQPIFGEELKVGDRIRVEIEGTTRTVIGNIDYIFREYRNPDEIMVYKYYGMDKDNFEKGNCVYFHRRVAVKQDNGKFVVVMLMPIEGFRIYKLKKKLKE